MVEVLHSVLLSLRQQCSTLCTILRPTMQHVCTTLWAAGNLCVSSGHQSDLVLPNLHSYREPKAIDLVLFGDCLVVIKKIQILNSHRFNIIHHKQCWVNFRIAFNCKIQIICYNVFQLIYTFVDEQTTIA